jgi:hypothetical protein
VVRQLIFDASWHVLARLGLEVLTGAITYPLALLTFHRERVRALVSSFRILRGGGG